MHIPTNSARELLDFAAKLYARPLWASRIFYPQEPHQAREHILRFADYAAVKASALEAEAAGKTTTAAARKATAEKILESIPAWMREATP